MPLTYSLKGQTAIVTGGASGIGRATAALLAQADAAVFVLDRDTTTGEEVASSSPNISFISCDMASRDSVDNAFQTVIEKAGSIDILVNNVGMWLPDGNILEMPEDSLATMETVNVLSPLHLTRLVMNNLIQQQRKGCITFVASTQAQVVDGAPTIYNVQKNTIIGMAKAFAVAGGPYDIRVNAISPGAISTDGMGAAEAVGKERILAGNHKTPLGRRGTPEEVAHEIVNLCFATYTTGDHRTVDGGFSKVALPASLALPEGVHPEDPDKNFLTK